MNLLLLFKFIYLIFFEKRSFIKTSKEDYIIDIIDNLSLHFCSTTIYYYCKHKINNNIYNMKVQVICLWYMLRKISY